jgi:putative tricarboxylic transport membrane protein
MSGEVKSTSSQGDPRSVSIVPHLCVAIGVLIIAGLSFWQAAEIPKPVLQVAVGPAVAPWFITAFLAACGVGLIFAALRGGWAHDQDGTITEWGSLGFVALGLFVNVALIDIAGFILAATLMFPLVARGFGSTNMLRDAAIGFVLAFSSYILFDRVLGYKIGRGLIESLI